MNHFWIIIISILAGLPCAWLGSFLVLRKMAMIGDAISHSILPGIVIAYLMSGQKDSFLLFLGASLFGILSTFLIEYLHSKSGLQADASIGITFTFLFSLGVILICYFSSQIDLDQDCVLYGELAYSPLSRWIIDIYDFGPKAFWVLFLVVICTFSYIYFFYQPLKLVSFDEEFAKVSGINVMLWHYSLMGMVSFITVSTFEEVGSILVISNLVVPALTAFLISKNFKRMLFLASFFLILSCILGYGLAYFLNVAVAASISLLGGLIFGIVFITEKMISNQKKYLALGL